jgi:hypothetical protein
MRSDVLAWLLLETTAQAGREGDRMARTTLIQRVNTEGGLAPQGACDPKVDTEERRVPYEADYFFWRATGSA